MTVRAELETDRARAVRRVIWITLVLNLGVAIAKIGYGTMALLKATLEPF